ncbi:hypothetical protein [uncultured Psychrosphaera sp.]|uniref:hypothetical protein n=1 Tax=uncultured Psychrosphaera sp. TaxID=1403522 RepID=UPI002628E8D8|nr:hypothetical protein [uncultured Psychrosphaera sp.]
MSLIDYGVYQGSVIGFASQDSFGNHDVVELKNVISNGRFGLFESKQINVTDLFVVLTQSCSIKGSKPKNIELVQLKQKTMDQLQQEKQIHKFDGKDYDELLLRVDQNIFSADETLITKIPKKLFIKAFNDGLVTVKNRIDGSDHKRLIDWRLLTYRREPFPDNFNAPFKDYLGTTGEWFSNFLSELKEEIDSIRVFITPDDIEDADLYTVSFCALLTTGNEDIKSKVESNMSRFIEELNQIEGIRCAQHESYVETEGEYIEGVNYAFTATFDEFTFENAAHMREFNLQFLCY